MYSNRIIIPIHKMEEIFLYRITTIIAIRTWEIWAKWVNLTI